MKGIVFGGCSFTWGQGLYYYHGLETLKEPPANQYIAQYVRPAHLRYMESIRFPRLVANYFDTFEVVKFQNGGSEDETIKFIDYIFDSNNNTHTYLHTDKFNFSEIEYIIIQTSQPTRNSFTFTLNDETYSMNLQGSNPDERKPFFQYLEQNNITYDEWLNSFIKEQVDRLKIEMKFYEGKGIKVRLLCWERDFISSILADEFLNDRLIRISYFNGTQNKKYETIRELMKENPSMEIQNDFQSFTTPPKDHHPSRRCHEVIAENIINYLEKEEIWQRPNIPTTRIH